MTQQPLMTTLPASPYATTIERSKSGYWRCGAAAFILLLAGFLLFGRLGHYALWDDEANTALFAEGICETGDTSALIGHNLIAYDGGRELKNLRGRFIPPLPAYLDAVSFLAFGRSALSARIPFAACGIASFLVIIVWLYKERATGWTWGLISFALLSNVSLILYCRQARYYACAIFLSILISYLYLHWSTSFRWKVGLLLAACALAASNYISFGAICCCAGVDWSIWGRHSFKLRQKDVLFLFGCSSLALAALLFVYNPFNLPPKTSAGDIPLTTQISWNVRDLSVNEFCVFPVLALIPFISFWRRDIWLMRGGLALLVYFAAVNWVEPHHGTFPISEVRYLSPIIPLCAAIEVRALLLIVGRYKWIAVMIAVPVLGSNVLSGSLIVHPGTVLIPLRCTWISYLHELAAPPADPYSAASHWANANLPANATVLVLPKYAAYPLMFHSPQLIYAWQLTDPPSPQFKSLADIHFEHRIWPQYLILFGREGLDAVRKSLAITNNQIDKYKLIETIPIYGKDMHRPELFIRDFQSPRRDLRGAAIYVLRKVQDEKATTRP